MSRIKKLGYKQPTAQQINDADEIVRRFEELWARPVAERFRKLMHDETRNLVTPITEPPDSKGVVEHISDTLRQFPNMRLYVVRWAPAGDIVMIEWAASAFIAGRPLQWSGIDSIAVRDGRIYETESHWDSCQLLRKATEANRVAHAPISAEPVSRGSHRKALAKIYFDLWRLL